MEQTICTFLVTATTVLTGNVVILRLHTTKIISYLTVLLKFVKSEFTPPSPSYHFYHNIMNDKVVQMGIISTRPISPYLCAIKTYPGLNKKTRNCCIVCRYICTCFVVGFLPTSTPSPHIHAQKKPPWLKLKLYEPVVSYVYMRACNHKKVWVCSGSGSKMGRVIFKWNFKY